MIKVYLDWNCITHCKDSLVELKELLIKRYNNVFICPFSEAHIRDVLTKSNCGSEYYEQDLDLLTQISGGNMLLLKRNTIKLYKVNPREYISKEGDVLDYIQNEFTFPYDTIRQSLKLALNDIDRNRISKEDAPQNVIPLIDKMVRRDSNVNTDINSILERSNTLGNNTLETKIKQVYYVLDMLGYKSEDKRKSFANIDTDAQHIALASLCDYLITNDKKMRDKANAIYSHMHCVTKVMDSQAFIDEMPIVVKRCYDLELIPNAMATKGTPTIKEDGGAVLKALDYPLWGTFKYCYNAKALNSKLPENMAVFLPDNQFMFYDEIRPLAIMTSLLLPESQRKLHIENYIQSYVQSKPIEKIAFIIDAPKYKYNFVLMAIDGFPALQVTCESHS